MKIQKIFFAALLSIALTGYNSKADAEEASTKVEVPVAAPVTIPADATHPEASNANIPAAECTTQKEAVPVKAPVEPESRTVFNAFKSELDALINQENAQKSFLLLDKEYRRDDSPLYDFFGSDILFWAEKYNRLGILDEVLDTYFEITETTPNTVVKLIGTVDKEKTSFFQFVTDSAAYGYKPAEILFEKLLERGGDSDLIINGSNTIECIQKRYDQFHCQGYNGTTQQCKNVKEILRRLKNDKEAKRTLSDFKNNLEEMLTDRQAHYDLVCLIPLIKNAEKFENLGILDKALDYFFEKTKKNPNSVIEKWMMHRGRDTTFFGFATFPEYSTDKNTIFQYVTIKAAVSGKKRFRILFEKLLQRGGDATVVTYDTHNDRKTNTEDDIKNECDYYCNHASQFIGQHIYAKNSGHHHTEYTRDAKEDIAEARCKSSQYISQRLKEVKEGRTKKEKAQ